MPVIVLGNQHWLEDGALHKSKVEAISLIFTIIAFIILSARLYVRIRVVKHFALDDILMIVAFAASLEVTISIVCEAEWGSPLGLFFTSPRGLKATFFSNLGYPIASGFVKLSIMSFCFTVFGQTDPRKRMIIQGIMAFVAVHMVSAFMTLLLGCRPISVFWTPEVFPRGCINIVLQSVVHGVISLITDAVVLTTPIVLLLGVRIEKKNKVFLLGILGLGGAAFLAGLVRVVALIKFSGAFSSPETWVILPIVTSIELNVAISAASLPALSPLLKKAFGQIKTVTSGYIRSNQSGQGSRNGTNARTRLDTRSKSFALQTIQVDQSFSVEIESAADKPQVSTTIVQAGNSSSASSIKDFDDEFEASKDKIGKRGSKGRANKPALINITKDDDLDDERTLLGSTSPDGPTFLMKNSQESDRRGR